MLQELSDATAQAHSTATQHMRNVAPVDFVFGGPLDLDLEEWQEKR